MRELTIDERFSQMITVDAQREFFMVHNTSPMPDFEQVGAEWVKVHRIRYEGSTGTKNVWGL